MVAPEEKSVGFTIWEALMSVQNYTAIHPVSVEIFSLDQSGVPTNIVIPAATSVARLKLSSTLKHRNKRKTAKISSAYSGRQTTKLVKTQPGDSSDSQQV